MGAGYATGGYTVQSSTRAANCFEAEPCAVPFKPGAAARRPDGPFVTYYHGKEGRTRRDSGDSIDGMDIFVTDPVGTSMLGSMLDVRGGDSWWKSTGSH